LISISALQSLLNTRTEHIVVSRSNMAQKSEGQEVRLRNRVRGFLDLVSEANQATTKKVLKACSELASEFPHAHLAKVCTVLYLKHMLIWQRKLIESHDAGFKLERR
jgi:hypothetical protein